VLLIIVDLEEVTHFMKRAVFKGKFLYPTIFLQTPFFPSPEDSVHLCGKIIISPLLFLIELTIELVIFKITIYFLFIFTSCSSF